MKTPVSILLLSAICLTSSAESSELGRLFFSPDERTRMEQQALKNQDRSDRDEAPGHITVNGIIRRGDGSRIAWINGQPQEIGAHSDPNVVVIRIEGKPQPVEVTVGRRVVLDNAAAKPTDKEAHTP